MIDTCMIDVGAHWGELSLPWALRHPDVPVFLFEPDPRAFGRLCFTLPNVHPFMAAISELDGFIPFYLCRVPGTSSPLRLNHVALDEWPGGENFAEVGRIWSLSLRLDTFLDWMNIEQVQWLKVDTQGFDLAVLRSLGDRIVDCTRITVEAPRQGISTYREAATQEDLTAYLAEYGFYLATETVQTCGYEANLTYER